MADLSRPNILLIQADQLSASVLPWHGGVTKTPHLSKLAETSVIFDAAYTNFPLCAPSRAAMMSGRLASEVGVYDNAADLASSVPTFAHYLRAAGYHTALIGKMHFIGPDQLHGFDERHTTDIYPSTFAWTFDPKSANSEIANDLRAFTTAGPVLRNPQLDFDEEVLHQTKSKLFDLARGRSLKEGQPWHLTVSFTHPHPPYQCPVEHWDRYTDDEIDLPRVPSIPEAEAHPYSTRLREEVSLRGVELSDEQIRNARHGYFGAVSYVDDLVGGVLEALRASNQENTVVIFTSDHGDMLGERGLWYKKLFFEDACRVPLLVNFPQRFGATRVTANVSHVDVLPTLLAIADPSSQIEPVDHLDGTSLIPLLETGVDPDHTDTVYAENLAEGTIRPLVMVKRGAMKLVTGGGPDDPDQLYDLSNDPIEMLNRIDDPGLARELAKLEQLASQRWNLDELHTEVVTSHRRRLFLRSLSEPAWGYEPPNYASGRVLRDGTQFNEWLYDSLLLAPGD